MIRVFNSHDWWDYAGAEATEDGLQPLIADIEGGPTVIADATGLSITNPDTTDTWFKIRCEYPMARALLIGLDLGQNSVELGAGFSVGRTF